MLHNTDNRDHVYKGYFIRRFRDRAADGGRGRYVWMFTEGTSEKEATFVESGMKFGSLAEVKGHIDDITDPVNNSFISTPDPFAPPKMW